MKIVKWVLVVLVVLFVTGYFAGTFGMSAIKKMVIARVDLTTVPDGVYAGSFHKARWNHDVEVTVRDNKILSIKNTNSLPDEAHMKIVTGAVDAMVAKQSVDIDVISGASINTKAFQLAVANALTEGVTKN